MAKVQPIPGYTQHVRGGFYRSYKGHSLFCGGAGSTRKELDKTFLAKCAQIDAAGELRRREPGEQPYREVLSEFMKAMEVRLKTRKPRPLMPRTFKNYEVELNDFGEFVGGGTPFRETNRPEVFTAYLSSRRGKKSLAEWKPSGFDSVISRVGALYRWAVEMEYIDRYRPGPQFQRPAKQHIRDERIDLSKSYTTDEFAKLYAAANRTVRCWLGLGLFCAFNNSDVAHLSRATTDLDAGVIDFRRRKTGRIRRVCPLPDMVVEDMRRYVRPEPAEQRDAGLFFITKEGNPYTRTPTNNPTDSISRLFRKLEDDAGVSHRMGRNFSGLRTTFYNLAPRSGYDTERQIVMGRAQGTIDLDHYLEDVGLNRLRHVVSHVWDQVSTALRDAVRDREIPMRAFAADATGAPAGPAPAA